MKIVLTTTVRIVFDDQALIADISKCRQALQNANQAVRFGDDNNEYLSSWSINHQLTMEDERR